MYYVYALVAERYNNRIYVGLTSNLERRLKEHNSGKMQSTKYFVPWKIFYFEKVETRTQARRVEKQFKSGFGKERLKEILRACSSTG